jgi:2-keto-4-pentenoate hydratase
MMAVSFCAGTRHRRAMSERNGALSETRDIAAAFVAARRNRAALSAFPGSPPVDLAEAYAIQDCALSLWDRAVGGWKVGRIKPPRDALLGADRLAGPIFRDTIVMAGAAAPAMPVFHGGFAAFEAEFMLRLAPQDGPLPTTPAEAMAWVDEVRIGIEIASSPYARINADGPCVTIADHGNNGGLLLGTEVPHTGWAGLDAVEVTLEIDGAEVGRATTATMLDGPFGAVAFLIGNLAARGIALEAGWWISSGAITGVHPAQPGSRATARFAGLGSLSVRMI